MAKRWPGGPGGGLGGTGGDTADFQEIFKPWLWCLVARHQTNNDIVDHHLMCGFVNLGHQLKRAQCEVDRSDDSEIDGTFHMIPHVYWGDQC